MLDEKDCSDCEQRSNAELFGEFVGICSEDDCEYGESFEEGKISKDCK